MCQRGGAGDVFVLRRLKHYCRAFNISIIAYCLMPNHYHLLVRQDGEQAAGLLPQCVFNSYTKAYNKRYQHSGTLFECRFQAKAIQSDSHLLHLCVYIHANPVKDGLVAAPEDWAYSNYREWINQRAGTLVDRVFVREHFGTPAEYRALVMDYLQARRRLPEELEAYLQKLAG
ncbi:MAG: transposase [Anaerolineae bacterium]|nr:transposase [Anaerolineae bacterium]